MFCWNYGFKWKFEQFLVLPLPLEAVQSSVSWSRLQSIKFRQPASRDSEIWLDNQNIEILSQYISFGKNKHVFPKVTRHCRWHKTVEFTVMLRVSTHWGNKWSSALFFINVLEISFLMFCLALWTTENDMCHCFSYFVFVLIKWTITEKG